MNVSTRRRQGSLIHLALSLALRIIVADYNLPGGMTGPQTIRAICGELGQQVPALVVSGDKSADALDAFEAGGFMLVAKPVRTADLMSSVGTFARIARPGWQRVKRARMPITPVGIRHVRPTSPSSKMT